MLKMRIPVSLLTREAQKHLDGVRVTVQVFSRPNGMPARANVQGITHYTYNEQYCLVTALDMKILMDTRWDLVYDPI